MSDWLSFLETLDFAPLVPEAYARYRPAVADGLGFYLGELSPLRAAAMLADQAALEEEAGIEARLVAFARHSPALHKLGQVMARDRRLPAGFRALLQTLETIVPPPDREPARAVLEAELGPLAALGIDLPEPPLAEASVAIVIPFARRDGGGGDGAGPAGGVFKVLKPGIEEALEEDLDILQRLGARLDEKCRALGLPAIDYGTAFARVRELLRLEVRLDREQANLADARRIHAGMPAIQVPEPYPALSTPRVTAMRRVYGAKVTEIDGLPAEARRRLAGRVIEALIAGPLWSPAPEALFHADPHAGNLMATPEGGLAILDWSLTGRLPKTSRESLTQILVSAAMTDAPAIARTIAGLAHGPVDETAVRRVVDEALGRLGPGDWPGLAWLIGLMDGMAFEARVPFDADLMMFRKALHTLHGVAADIDDRFPADQALVQAFLARFGAEWTPRLLAPPFSRHFATHLSNADLATFLMATPLIASRYWLGLFGR